MHASSPAALSAAFAAAMSAGDLDAALELWLPDAAIIAADGRVIAGRDALAPALAALIDHGVALTIDLAAVYDAGETAIGTGTLTMSSADGAAEAYEHSSEAVIVYRRVEGGGWRIALDAPWGLPAA